MACWKAGLVNADLLVSASCLRCGISCRLRKCVLVILRWITLIGSYHVGELKSKILQA